MSPTRPAGRRTRSSESPGVKDGTSDSLPHRPIAALSHPVEVMLFASELTALSLSDTHFAIDAKMPLLANQRDLLLKQSLKKKKKGTPAVLPFNCVTLPSTNSCEHLWKSFRTGSFPNQRASKHCVKERHCS